MGRAGWIEWACVRLASRLGYRLERCFQPRLLRPIPAGAKLSVGCGELPLPGYQACDSSALPHVDLICRAWQVSDFCCDLDEIYTRNLLPRLTIDQTQRALRDWYQALGPQGCLRIEIPNLEFAIAQVRRALWTDAQWNDKFSEARWGMSVVFGWQIACNPAESPADYLDLNHSGYGPDSLRFFLTQAGFQAIDISCTGFTASQNRRRRLAPHLSQNCRLVTTAYKAELCVARAA